MLESIGIVNLWAYLVGVFLIVIVPGPNSIFVLTASAKYGVRGGYKAAMGVFTGDALLIFLAFLGVATVVKNSPALFHAIQYLGAAYLLYLGIKTITQSLRVKKSQPEVKSVQSSKGIYFKALGLSILNPKMIIFYVSFFIQFIDFNAQSTGLSFLVLGAILQLCSMLYLSLLIFAGFGITNKVKQHKKLATLSNTFIGSLFVMFALRLALTA